MPGDIKSAFADAADFAITVAGLSSVVGTAAHASAVIDNSVTKYLDAELFFSFKTGAAGANANGSVDIYVYGSVDGVNYPEDINGTDAAVTLTVPDNLILVGTVRITANSSTKGAYIPSIAEAFGGKLPQRWGIVVVNRTGTTLDGNAANHKAKYQCSYLQYT